MIANLAGSIKEKTFNTSCSGGVNMLRRLTDEEITKANNMDIMDYINELNLPYKKAGKTIKVEGYGGLYIDPVKNRWNCFSQDIGGGPIQLVKFIEGKSWLESVKTLLGNQYQSHTVNEIRDNKKSQVVEKKDLVLPEKNNTYNHAIAYLIKTRGIDKDIVYEFIKDKKLYEDKKRNCVFVGYDKGGAPQYAGLRGTNTNIPFRGEVPDSDKSYSFSRSGTTNKLYVFESPIELMSYLTLEKIYKNNTDFNHHMLSLGGLSTPSLDRYLRDYPKIEEITFCLNNDKWGIKATKEHKNKYEAKYKVNVKLPNLKDYNEELLSFLQNKKRYYQLFKYEDNAVGGVFAFATSDELEDIKKEFSPDKIEEIDQTIYDREIKNQHRKFMRLATGYPKDNHYGIDKSDIGSELALEDEWELEM